MNKANILNYDRKYCFLLLPFIAFMTIQYMMDKLINVNILGKPLPVGVSVQIIINVFDVAF